MAAPHSPSDLSAGEKAWRGIVDDMRAAAHSPEAPVYDPYGPGSTDYDTRTREQVLELPGGLVRIDYGARV
jgi:hypothetical protein